MIDYIEGLSEDELKKGIKYIEDEIDRHDAVQRDLLDKLIFYRKQHQKICKHTNLDYRKEWVLNFRCIDCGHWLTKKVNS